jgi:hypothetical protein
MISSAIVYTVHATVIAIARQCCLLKIEDLKDCLNLDLQTVLMLLCNRLRNSIVFLIRTVEKNKVKMHNDDNILH